MEPRDPAFDLSNRIALYHDPIFLEHDTGDHPENKNRLVAIENALKNAPFAPKLDWLGCRKATIEEIESIHPRAHIERLKALIESGIGAVDLDTIVSPKSFDAACAAAGAAIDAVDEVALSGYRSAFLALRPPGHHAESNRAMGFCLINNIALAARAAIEKGYAEKVAIIDFDLHHGNGTQEIFYADPTVLYISTHQEPPCYPGTGARSETGRSAGLGATINRHFKRGADDDDFIALYKELIETELTRYEPGMILISAGFDAHRADPLGSLNFTEAGFFKVSRMIADLAAQKGLKIVSALEGGYDLDALAGSVRAHLSALLGLDAPA